METVQTSNKFHFASDSSIFINVFSVFFDHVRIFEYSNDRHTNRRRSYSVAIKKKAKKTYVLLALTVYSSNTISARITGEIRSYHYFTWLLSKRNSKENYKSCLVLIYIYIDPRFIFPRKLTTIIYPSENRTFISSVAPRFCRSSFFSLFLTFHEFSRTLQYQKNPLSLFPRPRNSNSPSVEKYIRYIFLRLNPLWLERLNENSKRKCARFEM